MATAPGKAFRKCLTVPELVDMFPTENAAREWFEAHIWPDDRVCPRFKGSKTVECEGHPPMTYR